MPMVAVETAPEKFHVIFHNCNTLEESLNATAQVIHTGMNSERIIDHGSENDV